MLINNNGRVESNRGSLREIQFKSRNFWNSFDYYEPVLGQCCEKTPTRCLGNVADDCKAGLVGKRPARKNPGCFSGLNLFDTYEYIFFFS